MNFFKKIKKFCKNFSHKILILVGVATVGSIAITAPIVSYQICKNQNEEINSSEAVPSRGNSSLNESLVSSSAKLTTLKNKNDNIPHVSTSWSNDTLSEKAINGDFTNILNYSPHYIYPDDSFISLVQTSSKLMQNKNSVHTKQMVEISHLLKSLNKSQQNQVKNVMLKMDDFVAKKTLTQKDLPDILNQITTQKNVTYSMNYVQKYEEKINEKEREVSASQHENLFCDDCMLYANNDSSGYVINNLSDSRDAFLGAAVAAALFSAAMYAAAWWFGISLPWAIASSGVAIGCGLLAGILGISVDSLKAAANKAPSGWATGFTTLVTVYNLGRIFSKALLLSIATESTLSALSWVMPLVSGVVMGISLVVMILSQLNMIN